MTYQSLVQAGLLEPYTASESEIRGAFEIARRDVKTARELRAIDLDWALIVAYNASLQAATGFMLAHGFRAKGPDRHKTVIRFLRDVLDPSLTPELNRLERVRRKRHQAVYRLAGSVSEGDAKGTIEFAEKFVESLHSLIQK